MIQKKLKICHVTSAHNSDDHRIFINECSTLAKKGYDTYIVANGDSYEANGVHVIGAGVKPSSRKQRMTTFARKVINIALTLNCDIYHLHDPELMRFIPYISRKRKKVIFDSHEDYKDLMLAKEWIPKLFRKPVSFLYSFFERYICRYLDGYIACYHWTKDRVEKWVPNVQLVFNYPEWRPIREENYETRLISNQFCYAGGISAQWMHSNVINAITKVDNAIYLLAGDTDTTYGYSIKNSSGWERVRAIGRIKHESLPSKVYSQSIAGICLLDYIPQCKGQKGNLSNTKLFEYMVNGLPVICTDFELWKDIIEEYNCGIAVNPHCIESISEAMNWMLLHPKECLEMGIRGNLAVKEKYNWNKTSIGLFKVYNEVEKRMGKK